jgi:hypothetical protein
MTAGKWQCKKQGTAGFSLGSLSAAGAMLGESELAASASAKV